MHFFIDHTKLVAQTDSHIKFGPSPSDPTGRYYLSTEFKLADVTKAFACQPGNMIVQRNDAYPDSLVNLIIKPSRPTNVNGIAVRYYVYRSVKLSSFFTNAGDDLSINVEDAANNTEFITTFWNRQKTSKQPISNPTPLNFGYGQNDLPLTDPNNLNELRPIRDIFNGKAPAKSYPVIEGMWIGDFTNTSNIGFEIELESELGLISTLKTYRSSYIWFDTDGYVGLALKRRKELISSYIDPAAFFGMHADVGVSTTTYSNNGKNIVLKTLAQNNLYADVIVKFKNKNRVYLDIRSEKGLSYNFYNNYKISSSDLRNLVLDNSINDNATGFTTVAELNQAAESYETNGWPIIIYETARNYNTTYNNKLDFRLRIDGNIQPVLYVENIRLSSTILARQTCFFKKNSIEDDSQDQWTKKMTLYFPNINAGTRAGDPLNSNVAYYIRIYYFLGEPVTVTNSGDNPRLINEKYFNSAFCSIDLENLGDTTIKNRHVENPNPIYIKEALHDDGTGNFSFAAQSGAYWDDNRILFYSKSYNKKIDILNPGKHDGSGKKYLRTYRRRINIANAEFKNNLRNSFYYVCKQYYLNPTGTSSLKILGLNSYHKIDRQGTTLYEKEDLMLIGLTIAQIQAIKNTPFLSADNPSGLSNSHPRYIFLEQDHVTHHLTDASTQRYRYYRYIVRIQGLSLDAENNPVPAMVTPTLNSQPIKVYSRDNTFFSSAEFADSEVLSPTLNIDSNNSQTDTDEIRNRIEFRIYRDGDIFINDNIDLSLVRKKEIPANGLTEGQGATTTRSDTRPIYSLNDDDAIANDTSVAQKILYVFVNQNTDDIGIQIANTTELCNLEIIMSDARLYVNPSATNGFAAEAGASTNQDFINLNYTQQTFDFTPFNNNSVDAKIARKHSTNGNIIVRGTKNGSNVNRLYTKLNRKIFMVYVDRLTANAGTLIDTRMQWVGTVRCFARPDLFAVFLGALREIYDTGISTTDVELTNTFYQSGGFAFPDGSSFPSQNHVNGDAFDNDYFIDIGGIQANDQRFIVALNKFSKGKYIYRIGPSKSALRAAVNNFVNPINSLDYQNPAKDGGTTHNNHLHTDNKTIDSV